MRVRGRLHGLSWHACVRHGCFRPTCFVLFTRHVFVLQVFISHHHSVELGGAKWKMKMLHFFFLCVFDNNC